MRPPLLRALAVGSALAAALFLGGCGPAPGPEVTAHMTANGVTITVTLSNPADGRQVVRATFSPLQPGFHIYSIDLPKDGVDGLGIPTRLAVGGALTALGRPAASQATRFLRPVGLQVGVPVYPDGPVTFTLPVRQGAGRRADVIVSYGACSERKCLMPVTDEVIPLRLH